MNMIEYDFEVIQHDSVVPPKNRYDTAGEPRLGMPASNRRASASCLHMTRHVFGIKQGPASQEPSNNHQIINTHQHMELEMYPLVIKKKVCELENKHC